MITFREWHPVGVEEYGYAVPDPLNADIIYGGKVTRYDRKIGQVQNVAPTPVRPADFRTLRTAPVVFSPVDPHVMYFASNTLWKTATGGRSWRQISPDLTRKTWDPPATIGKYRSADTAKPTQRGVIYTIAPSPLDANRIWVGTDDGLIHVTADGGATWRNVTPPDLKPWMKVSIMDAGHFSAQDAYAAINTLGSTTCARTSTGRTTAAGRGPPSPTAFPAERRSTSSAKIQSGRGCCSLVPSARSTCRSTTASIGSRCE
jgi:hypothetical protein